MKTPVVPVIMSPGLRNQTNTLAMCVGILHPKIYVDPMVDQIPGSDAVVMHEMGHAIKWHGLRALLWLIFFPPGYLWFRRTAEKEADQWAVRCVGSKRFRALVMSTTHPKSLWGRWLYTRSREYRLCRAEVRR